MNFITIFLSIVLSINILQAQTGKPCYGSLSKELNLKHETVRPVDFLFVVDRSKSMENDLGNISKSISSFLVTLKASNNIQPRIRIISYLENSKITLDLSSSEIQSSTKEQLYQKIMNASRVEVTKRDVFEKPILAINTHLPEIKEWALAYQRNDAHLAIGIITDEGDNSSEDISRGLSEELVESIKGTVSISALIDASFSTKGKTKAVEAQKLASFVGAQNLFPFSDLEKLLLNILPFEEKDVVFQQELNTSNIHSIVVKDGNNKGFSYAVSEDQKSVGVILPAQYIGVLNFTYEVECPKVVEEYQPSEPQPVAPQPALVDTTNDQKPKSWLLRPAIGLFYGAYTNLSHGSYRGLALSMYHRKQLGKSGDKDNALFNFSMFTNVGKVVHTKNDISGFIVELFPSIGINFTPSLSLNLGPSFDYRPFVSNRSEICVVPAASISIGDDSFQMVIKVSQNVDGFGSDKKKKLPEAGIGIHCRLK